MLNIDEKKFLRDQLPHGYGKLIAERAGVTNVFVSLWFRDLYHSEKVEEAAIEVYGEYKKKEKKRRRKLFS